MKIKCFYFTNEDGTHPRHATNVNNVWYRVLMTKKCKALKNVDGFENKNFEIDITDEQVMHDENQKKLFIFDYNEIKYFEKGEKKERPKFSDLFVKADDKNTPPDKDLKF